MEGPGLGHRGREASLRNPTGFQVGSGADRGESRRGAHARIPVALDLSMRREREPASVEYDYDGGVP